MAESFEAHQIHVLDILKYQCAQLFPDKKFTLSFSFANGLQFEWEQEQDASDFSHQLRAQHIAINQYYFQEIAAKTVQIPHLHIKKFLHYFLRNLFDDYSKLRNRLYQENQTEYAECIQFNCIRFVYKAIELEQFEVAAEYLANINKDVQSIICGEMQEVLSDVCYTMMKKFLCTKDDAHQYYKKKCLAWVQFVSRVSYTNQDFDVLFNLCRDSLQSSDLRQQFFLIKRAYLTLFQLHDQARFIINRYLAIINDIQHCFCKAELRKKVKALAILYNEFKPCSEGVIFFNCMRFLKDFTFFVCGRQANFVKTQVKSFTDELQNNFIALEENIETLKFRFSKHPVVTIFSEIYTILKTDQTMSAKTKKILTQHFEKLSRELIAGKMRTLDEVEQDENYLRLELTEKFFIPPQLTAAGTFIGGSVFCLRGLNKFHNVVGALSCGIGFFYAYNQLTQYEKIIQPIKSTMEHLENVLFDLCNPMDYYAPPLYRRYFASTK